MHERASISTMRRWGMSWKVIIKCVFGFHGRTYDGYCWRCGKFIGDKDA